MLWAVQAPERAKSSHRPSREHKSWVLARDSKFETRSKGSACFTAHTR